MSRDPGHALRTQLVRNHRHRSVTACILSRAASVLHRCTALQAIAFTSYKQPYLLFVWEKKLNRKQFHNIGIVLCDIVPINRDGHAAHWLMQIAQCSHRPPCSCCQYVMHVVDNGGNMTRISARRSHVDIIPMPTPIFSGTPDSVT